MKKIRKLLLALSIPLILSNSGLNQSNNHKDPKSPNNLNIIIFTADDLGPNGVGLESFGGKMSGLTPNIDKIANAGVRFTNAYVNSSICMPSRGIIATGMYGFNSGHHGFFYAREEVNTMMEALRSAGYKTGILGKVAHSATKMSTIWDYVYDKEDLGSGRSPSKYYERTKAFVNKCKSEDQPFYLMVNSHDPHRPFQEPNGELLDGAEWPSKLYSPEEVFVPGFLPDIPQVRKELSYYYNSTRRLDDTFGKVMEALEDVGVLENTVIVFLSDNGIAMPFSKANCYLKATRTSMFVHRPGVYKPKVYNNHFIETIDLYPTLMDMLGQNKPKGIDGKSFLPLLEGKSQKGRAVAFTQIDYINQSTPYPMRSVQDLKFGYIFNPWSDNIVTYKNANEGEVINAMQALTENEEIQARVALHRHRVVEEFYDLKNDPNCLVNLANNDDYKTEMKKYRKILKAKMRQNGDPLLEAFNNIDDKEKMKSLYLELYSSVLKYKEGDVEAYNSKIDTMQVNNYE